MANIKILIADADEKYILALERRFIDGYEDQCELSVITEQHYLDKLFSLPQSFDIMIVSEDMYSPEFVRHEITNIFILTERHEEASATSELNISKIYKYISAKEIYNEIVSNLSSESAANARKRVTEIISIYSRPEEAEKLLLRSDCAQLWQKNIKTLCILEQTIFRASAVL